MSPSVIVADEDVLAGEPGEVEVRRADREQRARGQRGDPAELRAKEPRQERHRRADERGRDAEPPCRRRRRGSTRACRGRTGRARGRPGRTRTPRRRRVARRTTRGCSRRGGAASRRAGRAGGRARRRRSSRARPAPAPSAPTTTPAASRARRGSRRGRATARGDRTREPSSRARGRRRRAEARTGGRRSWPTGPRRLKRTSRHETQARAAALARRWVTGTWAMRHPRTTAPTTVRIEGASVPLRGAVPDVVPEAAPDEAERARSGRGADAARARTRRGDDAGEHEPVRRVVRAAREPRGRGRPTPVAATASRTRRRRTGRPSRAGRSSRRRAAEAFEDGRPVARVPLEPDDAERGCRRASSARISGVRSVEQSSTTTSSRRVEPRDHLAGHVLDHTTDDVLLVPGGNHDDTWRSSSPELLGAALDETARDVDAHLRRVVHVADLVAPRRRSGRASRSRAPSATAARPRARVAVERRHRVGVLDVDRVDRRDGRVASSRPVATEPATTDSLERGSRRPGGASRPSR